MVYDPVRGRCVLFGGTSQSVLNNETWEWDGSTWTLMSTAGPNARSLHALAYDGTRQRVILFGGTEQSGALPTDTWEWDGSQWTRVATTGPSGRLSPSMGFDLVRGEVVLFGGRTFNVNSESDETWVWNGEEWTRRQVVNKPPSRSAAAMWWDPISHDVGLFGGYHSTQGYDTELWRWNGERWAIELVPGGAQRYGHFMGFNWSNGRTIAICGNGTGVGVGTQVRSLIRSGPDIATQPQGVVTCREGWIGVNVEAIGGVNYQWRRNGDAIFDVGPVQGTQTPNLVLNGSIAPLTENLSGLYSCLITNGCGDTVSESALVQVINCQADLDDGVGAGSCDGAVTIDDILFFLGAFEAGSEEADLDDDGEPSVGTPDGAVTIEDLLFFLIHFEAGC